MTEEEKRNPRARNLLKVANKVVPLPIGRYIPQAVVVPKFYCFIRIWHHDSQNGYFLYEVNTSEERAIECVANYLNRKNVPEMYFDGRIIYPKRMGSIIIFRSRNTYFSSNHLHNKYPNGYTQNFDGWEITHHIFKQAHKQIKVLTVSSEGLFFKGQQYDAFKLIKGIIDGATKSIFIIDGYVDESVLNMLESKLKEVEVKILTFSTAKNSLEAAVSRFNSQHGLLEVCASRVYHDRFVIIDEKVFYHFGQSLKDLGNRGCMFSRIEQKSLKEKMLSEWHKEWDSAS